VKILGISGSLREGSSNTTLLKLAAENAPAEVELEIFRGLDGLPFFSPELDVDPPEAVTAFRTKLKEADGILISTPEYAFGMPGSLKNALDWTVSSGEFAGKTVAALSASPTSAGGDKAHAALLMTLQAMASEVVAAASMPMPRIYKRLNAQGEVLDPSLTEQMKKIMMELVDAIKRKA
jgi:chromate reductase